MKVEEAPSHHHDDSQVSIDPLAASGQVYSLQMAQQYRRVCYRLKPDSNTQTYAGNAIRTSRYTLLTWVPKSLFLQFRRSANVYFLVISVLTMMSFSPKNPFSMAGTFAAVLIFTIFKEAYEDYFRHIQDRRVNHSVTHRYDPAKGTCSDIQWREVCVGDVLEVRDGESVAADLVFLSSSHSQGLAFVNTMNLDGETNLKEKMALAETKHLGLSDLAKATIEVATDLPSMSLVKWNCNLRINSGKWLPLDLNQLLLRSCQLRNTDKVYGLVVYTGQESKVMLNSKPPPAKTSTVMRKMNRMLYTVYALQFLICVSFAGLSLHWDRQLMDTHLYLGDLGGPGAGRFFVQILTFYVAYSHLIPISLYVALEIVKLACSYLIRQDLQMYYAPDDRPASTRTSDLVEELGQVEFVFSDKTGTLTQNVMKFKKCSINGIVYGSVEGVGTAPGQDQRPLDVLNNSHPGSEDLIAMKMFFRHMSLCHSVFPTENPVRGRPPLYQASSPDELALVSGAANLGFVFCDKTTSALYTKSWGGDRVAWEILAEIPFNSNRKRMSVVFKEPGTQKVLLLCKGADQVIVPLLRPGQGLASLVQDHLHEFAVEGLRTLVLGQKYVDSEEFWVWSQKWRALQLSNAPDKDTKLDTLGAQLEQNLDLLGASAIEDKLQVGVPDTIAVLMAAGIRVWVLTGDKQETAIEIGKACNLITKDMKLLDLSCSTQAQFCSLLDIYVQQFVLST